MFIFNADDYGLTNIDTERIIELSSCGVIKSTSIAANSASEADLKLLQQTDMSTGIHINLVEGKPLSTANSLVNNEHLLYPKKQLFKRILSHRTDLNDVKTEVIKQFEKILDNKIHISHIDTHQNTHLIFPIRNIIIDVANKYGIRKMRGQIPIYYWFGSYNRFKSLSHRILGNYWSKVITREFLLPDFILLRTPGFGSSIENISHALKKWEFSIKNFYNDAYTYDIPCHLALSEFEYSLYKSSLFRDLLSSKGVRIGSYYDL